jgi:hypothetical protein
MIARLNPDGTPHLREANLTNTILEFLDWNHWRVVRTPAGKIHYRGVQWSTIFESGHSDYLCLRPLVSAGQVECFYLELKAQNAKTSRERKKAQAEFTADARAAGFCVYHAPDKCDDPWKDFLSWYQQHFGRQ